MRGASCRSAPLFGAVGRDEALCVGQATATERKMKIDSNISGLGTSQGKTAGAELMNDRDDGRRPLGDARTHAETSGPGAGDERPRSAASSGPLAERLAEPILARSRACHPSGIGSAALVAALLYARSVSTPRTRAEPDEYGALAR